MGLLKDQHPGHRDTLGVAEAQPRKGRENYRKRDQSSSRPRVQKAWMPGKCFRFCSESREVLYQGLTSFDLYFKRILLFAVLRRDCRRIQAGVAKASKKTTE